MENEKLVYIRCKSANFPGWSISERMSLTGVIEKLHNGVHLSHSPEARAPRGSRTAVFQQTRGRACRIDSLDREWPPFAHRDTSRCQKTNPAHSPLSRTTRKGSGRSLEDPVDPTSGIGSSPLEPRKREPLRAQRCFSSRAARDGHDLHPSSPSQQNVQRFSLGRPIAATRSGSV
jgi:hypothetical protein